MEFSNKEKNLMLKAVTTHIKYCKGKGPNNIYIKYSCDEMHIVIQGMLCTFEKYSIEKFGDEAINTLKTFYNRNCAYIEQELAELYDSKYTFNTYELTSDFEKDLFIYKISIKE